LEKERFGSLYAKARQSIVSAIGIFIRQNELDPVILETLGFFYFYMTDNIGLASSLTE